MGPVAEDVLEAMIKYKIITPETEIRQLKGTYVRADQSKFAELVSTAALSDLEIWQIPSNPEGKSYYAKALLVFLLSLPLFFIPIIGQGYIIELTEKLTEQMKKSGNTSGSQFIRYTEILFFTHILLVVIGVLILICIFLYYLVTGNGSGQTGNA